MVVGFDVEEDDSPTPSNEDGRSSMEPYDDAEASDSVGPIPFKIGFRGSENSESPELIPITEESERPQSSKYGKKGTASRQRGTVHNSKGLSKGDADDNSHSSPGLCRAGTVHNSKTNRLSAKRVSTLKGSLEDKPPEPLQGTLVRRNSDRRSSGRQSIRGNIEGMQELQAQDKTRSNKFSLKATKTLEDIGAATAGITAREKKIREKCAAIASDPRFEWTMGFIVFCNCVCIGLENERFAYDHKFVFVILDRIFLAIFTLELLTVAYGFGLTALKCPQGCLDVFIVLSGWAFEAMTLGLIGIGEGDVDLKWIQVMKVLRALRAVRVLRVLTMFDTLWVTVQSFTSCLKPLCWTVLFILMIIFLFAMFAVGLIGRNKSVHDDSLDNEEIQASVARFRSTSAAMLTLFQIMTLDEWYEIIGPLLYFKWTYLFFTLFISMCALSLMNLVTAVVVDGEMTNSKADDAIEREQKAFEADVDQDVAEMESIFNVFDSDGSGYLSCDEFVSNALEHTRLAKILTILGFTKYEDRKMVFTAMSADSDYQAENVEKENADEENVEQADKEMTMAEFVQAVQLLGLTSGDSAWVASIRAAHDDSARLLRLRRALDDKSKQQRSSKEILDVLTIQMDLDKRMTTLEQHLWTLRSDSRHLHKNLLQVVEDLAEKAELAMAENLVKMSVQTEGAGSSSEAIDGKQEACRLVMWLLPELRKHGVTSLAEVNREKLLRTILEDLEDEKKSNISKISNLVPLKKAPSMKSKVSENPISKAISGLKRQMTVAEEMEEKKKKRSTFHRVLSTLRDKDSDASASTGLFKMLKAKTAAGVKRVTSKLPTATGSTSMSTLPKKIGGSTTGSTPVSTQIGVTVTHSAPVGDSATGSATISRQPGVESIPAIQPQLTASTASQLVVDEPCSSFTPPDSRRPSLISIQPPDVDLHTKSAFKYHSEPNKSTVDEPSSSFTPPESKRPSLISIQPPDADRDMKSASKYQSEPPKPTTFKFEVDGKMEAASESDVRRSDKVASGMSADSSDPPCESSCDSYMSSRFNSQESSKTPHDQSFTQGKDVSIGDSKESSSVIAETKGAGTSRAISEDSLNAMAKPQGAVSTNSDSAVAEPQEKKEQPLDQVGDKGAPLSIDVDEVLNDFEAGVCFHVVPDGDERSTRVKAEVELLDPPAVGSVQEKGEDLLSTQKNIDVTAPPAEDSVQEQKEGLLRPATQPGSDGQLAGSSEPISPVMESVLPFDPATQPGSDGQLAGFSEPISLVMESVLPLVELPGSISSPSQASTHKALGQTYEDADGRVWLLPEQKQSTFEDADGRVWFVPEQKQSIVNDSKPLRRSDTYEDADGRIWFVPEQKNRGREESQGDGLPSKTGSVDLVDLDWLSLHLSLPQSRTSWKHPSPSASSPLAVGTKVEYWSISKNRWIAATVTEVDESDGAVILSVKPGFWLDCDDQLQKLRPRGTATVDNQSPSGKQQPGPEGSLSPSGLHCTHSRSPAKPFKVIKLQVQRRELWNSDIAFPVKEAGAQPGAGRDLPPLQVVHSLAKGQKPMVDSEAASHVEKLQQAHTRALTVTSSKLPAGSFARQQTLHVPTWQLLREGNASAQILRQLQELSTDIKGGKA